MVRRQKFPDFPGGQNIYAWLVTTAAVLRAARQAASERERTANRERSIRQMRSRLPVESDDADGAAR